MRPTIFVLLVGLVVPTVASAQIHTRGKTQFGIAAFGTVNPGQSGSGGSGSLSGQFSLTQFVTTGLELGGDLQLSGQYQGGSSSEFGDTPSSWNWNGNVFGRMRYNLVGQSLTVPYLSLGVGTTLDSQAGGVDITGEPTGSSRPLEYQAGVGIKRFINEKVSFNFEGDYQGETQNGSSFGAFSFLVGLSIYTGH